MCTRPFPKPEKTERLKTERVGNIQCLFLSCVRDDQKRKTERNRTKRKNAYKRRKENDVETSKNENGTAYNIMTFRGVDTGKCRGFAPPQSEKKIFTHGLFFFLFPIKIRFISVET